MKKIKIGLAGLGYSGLNIHIEMLKNRQDFIIEAVSDVDSTKLENVSKPYNCKAYSNFEDMCKDELVQLIVICTNSNLHADMAIKALKAGKNVVCEKPMASDLFGAREMVKACYDTGKMLTIFHNRRLDLDFQLVKKTVKSGKLGKVFKINRNILEYCTRSDWQIWKNKGGGHLNNWGTHLIDQMLYLTGKSPELQFSNLARLKCEGDAEDYFHGIFQFDDGLIYELELSYASMLKLPEWMVWGDKGALMIDTSEVIIEYEQDGKKITEKESIEQDNFLVWQGFYNNLYNHLNGKEELLVKPDEVLKVMELINEAKKGTDFC